MSISRRNLLKQSSVAVVAAVAPVAASASTANVIEQAENPALLKNYERYLSASAELADAQNALEWLNDEWRHCWPLAPEELLNLVCSRHDSNVERDLIGRVVMREATELKQRLHAKFRRKPHKVCFTLFTIEQLEERARCLRGPVTGRTEAAIARRKIERTRNLAQCEKVLKLAREYYAETGMVWDLSGVAAVQQRLAIARENRRIAGADVRDQPAFTTAGLKMKATTLQDDEFLASLAKLSPTLAGILRFAQEAPVLLGEA
jgi:hypothetical protein